ncbi:MAG: PKD domain-containing protein, partial [Flavobacteriales bacterium]
MAATFAYRFLLLCFTFSLILVGEMGATHIVGGEIYYSHLGNNNYQITLYVYRDCGPTNVNGTYFDQTASIGVFTSSDGFLYEELSVDLVESNVDVVPIELENPCFVLPPDLCVQRARYVTTVNLPANPGGYTLVYQRCCRNPSIINLNFPDDTGTSMVTEIPGTDLLNGTNSSARFVNFPPVALCANAEFFFDHGATDPDGDSLVYEFCTPYNGASPDIPAPQPPDNPPYVNVSWANGFSSGYQITSNPAFQIDPQTGYITGTATQVGQYVIGICVSEYRNGVLVNQSNRDFQFNVTICDPNIIASIPEQTNFCDGLSIQFENTSTNGSFYHWDFGVLNIDSDTSNVANPFFTYPAEGTYNIMLIANPGWPCADTAITTYTALPVIQPIIGLGEYACVNNEDRYSFAVDANVSNAAVYSWNFGPGASPATSNLASPTNIQLNPENLTNTVTVTITDNNCEETDELVVDNPPDPVASIVAQESFCAGYTYTFEQNSTNATDFYWNFNTPINGDQSLLASPTFTFPDSGWYNITLIASAPFTCPDTTNMLFEIYELLAPSFEEQAPQCLSVNSFDFEAIGITSSEAIVEWSFGPNASMATSNSMNPQNISFDSPDYYFVTLTVSENGCVREYVDDVWVAADPTIAAEINNVEGCPDLYAQFEANGTSETQLFYTWNFGDGSTATSANPSHIYTLPGYYDVTVTAYTVNGCIASLTQQFPNAVYVFDIPQAGFTVDITNLDILNPEISVTDTSAYSISCNYYMSDGGFSDQCDFTYVWNEAGNQSITQFVMNEFGCYDMYEVRLVINGFLFFAPNSFTPNNDGMNDFWIPEMTGIGDYHCRIYNRWGALIFETFDPTEKWLGNTRSSDYFVPDGVYHYHIEANDLLGLS